MLSIGLAIGLAISAAAAPNACCLYGGAGAATLFGDAVMSLSVSSDARE